MINKLVYVYIILFINYSFSENRIIIDEALLISCQATGHVLFDTCVKTPPSNPEQITLCEGIRTAYLGCSSQLSNITIYDFKPMEVSKPSSPYSLSRYDPCKFEVNHLILFNICN